MTKDHQSKRNITEKVTLVSTEIETKETGVPTEVVENTTSAVKTEVKSEVKAQAHKAPPQVSKAPETKPLDNKALDKKEQEKKADVKTNTPNADKTNQAQTKTPSQSTPPSEQAPVIVKKGGTGVAVLALLVALGIGGVGYYFGQQQVHQIQQKLTALENRPAAVASAPDLAQERAAIAKLAENNGELSNKIAMLEQELGARDQALTALQNQIKAFNTSQKNEPNDWLLSEADFLLTNALRKLVLDNDVDTSISLLKVADESLQKVSDARVIPVRAAINADLKQLLSVNNVDQNAIMQRLSQLANTLDELRVLNVNFEQLPTDTKLTESVEDWQENAKKSVNSFLNNFIRVTPRNNKESKAVLAPSQEIYLRENIRLRLQIAILAVPRQQNELYKQSLEAVAAWVRSYFDTSAQDTQEFLKEIDELAAQSIYVNVPDQLHSLKVLDEILNRQAPEVQKVEINVDKQLAEESKAVAAEVNEVKQAESQAPAPQQEATPAPQQDAAPAAQ